MVLQTIVRNLTIPLPRAHGDTKEQINFIYKGVIMATVQVVNDEQSLNARLAEVRAAQAKYATYTQEQVDKIFFAAAMAANKIRPAWAWWKTR